MTNEELIATIRSEIERLKSQRVSGARAAQIGMETYCKKEAYDEVLSFISTLESEKPTNQDELEKELDRYLRGEFQQTAGGNFNNYIQVARHFYELGCTRTAEKFDEIEYNRQRANESERPQGDDLNEEVKRYYSDNFDYISSDQPTLSILTNIAQHFAQWGADHFRDLTKKLGDSSETPNGLEEAAKDYAYNEGYQDPEYYNIVEAFITGGVTAIRLMKEQMMEETVEGEITKDNRGNNVLRVGLLNNGFEIGDKVRIIVCKKED